MQSASALDLRPLHIFLFRQLLSEFTERNSTKPDTYLEVDTISNTCPKFWISPPPKSWVENPPILTFVDDFAT